jgi:hypothetical protein
MNERGERGVEGATYTVFAQSCPSQQPSCGVLRLFSLRPQNPKGVVWAPHGRCVIA